MAGMPFGGLLLVIGFFLILWEKTCKPT